MNVGNNSFSTLIIKIFLLIFTYSCTNQRWFPVLRIFSLVFTLMVSFELAAIQLAQAISDSVVVC